MNYLLMLAVSVLVVIVAVVAFRSLVDVSDAPAPAVVPTTLSPASTSAPVSPSPPPSTEAPAVFDCTRLAPEPDDDIRSFRLYFACGPPDTPRTAWVYRAVPPESGPLTQTLRALVAGPTGEERADGFRSPFSAATVGAVQSVQLTEGNVVVDLRDLGPMPGLAKEPEGSRFLADLNNTLFQYEVVTSVEYQIEGDCLRFWAYFGAAECATVTRDGWAQDPMSHGL